MDLFEVIEKRRSIRSYKSDPLPEDVFKKVLEAARLAPSANNIQPWKFIVVKDAGKREKLASLCMGQSFIAEAPVVIVACGLPTSSKIGGYTSSREVDVAIAVDHLTLAARALGLGTCWIGAFDNDKIKQFLNIPEEVQIVAITPLGYPTSEKEFGTSRKSLDEIVCWEDYQ